jgi:4-amino-4-deoxy-L-arabinose transferase-like glycosyltransferase
MQRLSASVLVRSPWFWLGLGLVVVYLRGLFLDVMDVDASQYASISQEMLHNGSWLQVQHRGADYLDKPPLLFWLSTASFWLFGISNWAYKLPSLLAALAGVWGVYRFTLEHYNPQTARRAAFLLASALGLIVICNDVRTDTLLLGATTCAVWLLTTFVRSRRWKHLLGGFFCVALAMMAKGPIGLVVPGFALGTHLLLNRQWRLIFQWQWLVGLVFTALLLLPMCWGLWQQFDLHPEKLVNNRTGVSGLYFYFWEQSFGRVTGENVWKNDASGFYFLHVYLWAFLPWCLLLPGALIGRLRDLLAARQELYSVGAFVLTFIAMSMSQYKLPHYIFITLPWAAVLLARVLDQWRTRWMWLGLYVAAGIGLVAAFLLVVFVFPTAHPLLWVALLAGTVGLLVRMVQSVAPADNDVLVQRGVWASILIGFVLNFHFYPHLLPYQSAKPVAQFARQNNIPPEKMAYLYRGSHALDFYNGDNLESLGSPAEINEHARKNGAFWLHVDKTGLGELGISDVRFEQVATIPHFQVALLKPAFLNPSRRTSVMDTVYLLKILPE